MSETREKFDRASAKWDEEPRRVKLAEELAAAVAAEVGLDSHMDVLDYGCGTGLVTLRLQPFVRSITGADTSTGMLDILRGKIRAAGVPNVTVAMLEPGTGMQFAECFDLVVSCMTMHHIPDVQVLLHEFRRVLRQGGTLVIADLDAEDGTFHGDAIPADHPGFDRGEMREMMKEAGFGDIRDVTAASIEKVSGAGVQRSYTVFLMIGRI